MPFMMLMGALFWFLVIGGGLYLGFRFVRAFEHGGARQKELEELRERVLRLEESLDAVHGDVARLADEQRFTTKLLTERSSTPPVQ